MIYNKKFKMPEILDKVMQHYWKCNKTDYISG